MPGPAAAPERRIGVACNRDWLYGWPNEDCPVLLALGIGLGSGVASGANARPRAQVRARLRGAR